MPELPEVETIRGQLAPVLVGRTVVEAGGHPSAKFASAPDALGATVESVRRRGKYLLFGLDDDRDLVIHLGMTGVLRLTGATDLPDTREVFVRAWWTLDNGTVFDLHDVRRFGRVAVLPRGQYGALPTLAALGPEPLGDGFTPTHLFDALRKSNVRLKTQLLNQRVVAGVGNIYADEALWQAEVNPAARTITRPRAARLHAAIQDVLAQGIANGGTRLRDYRTMDGDTGTNQYHLRCYGRAGEPCERCGTVLRHRTLDARGTTWCPRCQAR